SRGAGRPCRWVVWAPPPLDSHGVQSPCSSRCRPSLEWVKNRELQTRRAVRKNSNVPPDSHGGSALPIFLSLLLGTRLSLADSFTCSDLLGTCFLCNLVQNYLETYISLAPVIVSAQTR